MEYCINFVLSIISYEKYEIFILLRKNPIC